MLNNFGYGTERHILDGPFNDLVPWQYSRLPDLLGSGVGWVVETEEQLDQALSNARAHVESYCLIEVRLDSLDRSPALQRLAERLAKRV